MHGDPQAAGPGLHPRRQLVAQRVEGRQAAVAKPGAASGEQCAASVLLDGHGQPVDAEVEDHGSLSAGGRRHGPALGQAGAVVDPPAGQVAARHLQPPQAVAALVHGSIVPAAALRRRPGLTRLERSVASPGLEANAQRPAASASPGVDLRPARVEPRPQALGSVDGHQGGSVLAERVLPVGDALAYDRQPVFGRHVQRRLGRARGGRRAGHHPQASRENDHRCGDRWPTTAPPVGRPPLRRAGHRRTIPGRAAERKGGEAPQPLSRWIRSDRFASWCPPGLGGCCA